MASDFQSLDLRPYHLMRIVSRAGAGMDDFGSPRLNQAVQELRRKSYTPVRLRCNVSSVYAFQNPGKDEDTLGGDFLNVKRDLDIMQRLGLTPGVVMPAIDLFDLLLTSIPTADGIYGYYGDAAALWQEPGDSAEDYARGAAKGLGGVFTLRLPEVMARVKQESAEAVYRADRLFIRPHHFMCMTCFYGARLEPDTFAPIPQDNLYEAIVAIQRNPDIPVTLIQGPCMICPPCDYYDPETNYCYLHIGIGLRDEKKDLDALELLGLQYGDTLPARRLLELLYERIPSTRLVCGYRDGVVRGSSWRVCDSPEGSERYRQGRRAGMGVVEVD